MVVVVDAGRPPQPGVRAPFPASDGFSFLSLPASAAMTTGENTPRKQMQEQIWALVLQPLERSPVDRLQSEFNTSEKLLQPAVI